ncbi:MAG TPA: hypothetical protein VMY98_08960, partial [Anaerolineae bacterium]|nr:hypothetical protein [Anaerolineae bacterium]
SWTALFFLILAGLPLIPLTSSLFGGRPRRQPLLVGLLWTALFGGFVLTYYATGFSLAPQPIRYAPEAQMGCALLVGILLAGLFDRISRLPATAAEGGALRFRRGFAFVCLLVVLAVALAVPLVKASHAITNPHADITSTPEYRIAQWLESHLQPLKGERTYLTGTPAFWLNAFTEVPQLRGAADNAQPSRWWADISYQINKGVDGELAMLWLRALGIRYVVVNYPESGTPYVDYAFPAKFEGLLPMAYECDGFRVFEVTGLSGGLVEAVNLDAAQEVRIGDVLDRQGLSRLLELWEGVEDAQVEVTYDPEQNPDRVTIDVRRATPSTALLLKMTYDPRWHAHSAGTELSIEPVGPDFTLIIPDREGDFTVSLECRSLIGERVGGVVSCATLVVAIACILQERARVARQWRSHSQSA